MKKQITLKDTPCYFSRTVAKFCGDKRKISCYNARGMNPKDTVWEVTGSEE